ncbi:D-glycerate dehydrogenase [Vulcanibacillus modesticaldus]|uniref:D-glycerate dehydrogenase n=1 Tax=Vulcanibacillus modesticaldus TaxID=337097 RepID=A0A1D2YUJ3_9BACI|nr:D-glycerate dehydrogenase [Vulcanibacillus modesticaldus]OEF99357.1 D-glycerate dehydrogenase [Vulcanibacillus modesticaldus]
MAKPYVFVTRKISEESVELLKNSFEVKVWEEDRVVPREILLEEAKKADGLLIMLTDKIDSELINQAENLKAISTMAVGYDNIDLQSATEKGIIVTNTPGVLSEATADLTFGLLMTTARRISEANRYVLEGKWTKWSPMLMAGQDIYGATIGIIGMGRIGEAVAKRATGFDMKILYHNRNRRPEVEKKLNAEYRSLDELLKESDFIVLLTPLTPETTNLIGKREFELMKSSAVFINVSRGATVDEEALYDALINKKIWAAGLDVFRQEPVPIDHPLLQLENVVAIPHIGSASIKTRKNMAIMAVNNLIDALIKKESPNIVNIEVLE